MIEQGTTTNDLLPYLEKQQTANEDTQDTHNQHLAFNRFKVFLSKLNSTMGKSTEENTLSGWFIRLCVIKSR